MAQQLHGQRGDHRVRIKEMASSLLEVQMQHEALDLLKHIPAASQDRFRCICLLRFEGVPQGPPSTSHWTPEAMVYWNDLEFASHNRVWNTSQRWLGFCCQGCRRASMLETNGPTITPYTFWIEVPPNLDSLASFQKAMMSALWHCVGHVNTCFLRYPPLAADYPAQENHHLDAFLPLYARALLSAFYQNSLPMSLESQVSRQKHAQQQQRQLQQQQIRQQQMERERLVQQERLRIQQQQTGLYRENMQRQEQLREQILQQARMQEMQQQEMRRQALQLLQQQHAQQQQRIQGQQPPKEVPNSSTGGVVKKRKYTNFIATSSEEEDLFAGLQPHLDAISDRSRPTRKSIFHRFPQLCGPSVFGRISFPLLLVLQHYALQVRMHPKCIHYSLVCVHCDEKFDFRNSLAPDKGVHHALVQMSQDFVVNHLGSCGHTPAWVVKTFQRKLGSFSSANWSSFLKRIHRDAYSLKEEERSKASAACDAVSCQRHPWEMDCFCIATRSDPPQCLDLPNWVQQMDPEISTACPLLSGDEANFIIFGNELYREAPGNQWFRSLILKVRHEYLKLPTPEEREVAVTELHENIVASGPGASNMSMVRWTADEDPKFVPLPEEECLRIIQHIMERGFPELLRTARNPTRESRVVEVETVPMLGVLNDMVRWESGSNPSERILLRRSHVEESRSEWSKKDNVTPKDIAQAVEDMFGESCPPIQAQQQSFDYEAVEEPPAKKTHVDKESPPSPPPPQAQDNKTVIDLSLDDDEDGETEKDNPKDQDKPNASITTQKSPPRDPTGGNGRGKDLRLVQAQAVCANSTVETVGDKEGDDTGTVANKFVTETLGRGLGKNMASLRAIIAAEQGDKTKAKAKAPTGPQPEQTQDTPSDGKAPAGPLPEKTQNNPNVDKAPAIPQSEQTQDAPNDVDAPGVSEGVPNETNAPQTDAATKESAENQVDSLEAEPQNHSHPEVMEVEDMTKSPPPLATDEAKEATEKKAGSLEPEPQDQSHPEPMEVEDLTKSPSPILTDAAKEATGNQVDSLEAEPQSHSHPEVVEVEDMAKSSPPMATDETKEATEKKADSLEPEPQDQSRPEPMEVEDLTESPPPILTEAAKEATENQVDSLEAEPQNHSHPEVVEVEDMAKSSPPMATDETKEATEKKADSLEPEPQDQSRPEPMEVEDTAKSPSPNQEAPRAGPQEETVETGTQKENTVQPENVMVAAALPPDPPSREDVMVDATNKKDPVEPPAQSGAASKNDDKAIVEDEQDSSDDEQYMSSRPKVNNGGTVSQASVPNDSDTETDDSIGTGARRVIQTPGEDARGPAHRLLTPIARKKNGKATRSGPTPKSKMNKKSKTSPAVTPNTTATTAGAGTPDLSQHVGSQNDPVDLLGSSSDEEGLQDV